MTDCEHKYTIPAGMGFMCLQCQKYFDKDPSPVLELRMSAVNAKMLQIEIRDRIKEKDLTPGIRQLIRKLGGDK